MSMPAESRDTHLTLATLLDGIAAAPAIPLTGIADDSRRVRDGHLFIACQGMHSHGLEFAHQAIANGAAAIVFDRTTASLETRLSVPTVGIEQLDTHLGELANRAFAAPSHQASVVGVTGTNGKTTVAWMIAHCLQRLGRRCGYLGTLGHGIDSLQADTGLTTPPAIELHRRLAEFVDGGASHAAIEVSSLGLAQRRVAGVRFEAALFTNLSRDHLDYHGDMQAYFDSKAALFTDCAPQLAIINVDDPYGAKLLELCHGNVVAVSANGGPARTDRDWLRIRACRPVDDGFVVNFESHRGDGEFRLPLVGEFNVANAAMTLGYLLATGVDAADACAVLADVAAPPGRMQRVANSAVYVDYAHTPDALSAALSALRPHSNGELVCVFGCGGDRDAGKRPQMAEVAGRLADRVVVTTDNPRSESPQAIIEDIVAGLPQDCRYSVIADRAAAIDQAIGNMHADDVLLIAGKGHETYQEVHGERLPFSDYEVARAALEARAAGC